MRTDRQKLYDEEFERKMQPLVDFGLLVDDNGTFRMEKNGVLNGSEDKVVVGIRRLVVNYKEYWEKFKGKVQKTSSSLEGRVVNFRIGVFVDLVTSERCLFQIDELSPFYGLLPGMRGGHVLDLIALEVLNPWPE